MRQRPKEPKDALSRWQCFLPEREPDSGSTSVMLEAARMQNRIQLSLAERFGGLASHVSVSPSPVDSLSRHEISVCFNYDNGRSLGYSKRIVLAEIQPEVEAEELADALPEEWA